MTTKQCSRCKKLKDNNEFENDRRHCNECINKRREYYNNNKDKFKEWDMIKHDIKIIVKTMELGRACKKFEYECIVCQQMV